MQTLILYSLTVSGDNSRFSKLNTLMT